MPTRPNSTVTSMQILCQITCLGKIFVGCSKTWHLKNVCQSKRDRAMNKLEIKESQEGNKGEIETMSIKSVHLNKNQSLLMAVVETQSGRNTRVIPYKIDMGSKGNITKLT